MHENNFWESINYALQGIIHALKTQKNMKIHFLLAFLVMISSLFFNISKLELMILFLVISFVIAVEMINTSIEIVTDMIAQEYNYMIKIAKNIAAGAVLITAFNAIMIGYLIFMDTLGDFSLSLIHHIQQKPIHLIFINLGLLFIIVIYLKASLKEGTPLRGGMPSGHSAIAFSIVTMLVFLSNDLFVISLAVLLAFLVVQSRIQAKAHSFLEVLTGSILGILLTSIIFQFL